MTQAATAAAGRNRPCPCGSGRRYKECHGLISVPDGESAGHNRADPPAPHSGYRAPPTEWGLLSADEQNSLGATMEHALLLQKAGQPQEARKLYFQTLAAAPNTHDALHMLGVIELGFGNLSLAEDYIVEAMRFRAPYPAIESNLTLVRVKLLEQRGINEDQLAERALPILNDLVLAPALSRRAPIAGAGSLALHLIGRVRGEDEDDVWMLHRLRDVLAKWSPTVWAVDGAMRPSEAAPTFSTLSAARGLYPRGGTQVFVGLDYELGDWLEHCDADRMVAICGHGRPSRLVAQLRALAGDGARCVELAFVSRACAARFGPGHAVIPLPLEPPAAAMITTSAPVEAKAPSEAPRAWTIGMVGRSNVSVRDPADAKLIGEVAACANIMTIYDPGRYRFSLGVNPSLRFVPRSCAGLAGFIAAVDCLYCRRQPWWEEGAGRDVLTAMALGKPVVVPRDSIHAWLVEDRVDGLLYETAADAIGRLQDLRRTPGLAARLGHAARIKAQAMLAAAAAADSWRSIFPTATI